MATTFSNLHEKVTTAIAAVLKEKATDLGIDEEMVRAGIWGEDLKSPSVVVVVERISETYIDSGVYRAEVLACLSSVAPDTAPEEHNRRIAVMVDRLRSVQIAADLSGKQADFYVFQVIFQECENEREERTWCYKQKLAVIFRPTESQ